jgi:hypothetical protein
MPGFIAYNSFLEKVLIVICYIRELPTDPVVFVTLFQCQHSTYNVLAVVMYLHVLNEDGLNNS